MISIADLVSKKLPSVTESNCPPVSIKIDIFFLPSRAYPIISLFGTLYFTPEFIRARSRYFLGSSVFPLNPNKLPSECRRDLKIGADFKIIERWFSVNLNSIFFNKISAQVSSENI